MSEASPNAPETPPASKALRALMHRVNEYELWETMSLTERREIVLDHYAVSQWFEEPALPTLASFRQDAAAWGRIKAKGREIGVNVWDLEKAADAFLTQRPLSHEHPIEGPQGPMTPVLVGEIEDSMAFAMALIQVITAPVDGQGPHWLFEPPILARLQQLALEAPGLYQGLILPKVRALHIWVPDITQAIAGIRPPFDPFVFTDAAAMQATIYPLTRWLVSGLIADGLTIIGGSPKSGKSYLGYALALATARPALWCQHWHVEAGPVIFLSLEDDEADSAQRLQELAPMTRLPPGRLRFVNGQEHVPGFGQGFVPWVEEILTNYQPRLLVIDPISYLYVLKRTGNQFEETKDMLFPLRWLGKKYRCAIVCIDHRRKRSKDDVSIFDTLHGSVAKIAVADALLMVERDESEMTVAALVRKGKDQMLSLSLTFTDEGEATLAYQEESKQSTNYGALRQTIMTFLLDMQSPASVEDIILGCEFINNRQMKETVKKILFRAEKAREVERTTRGHYIVAGAARASHDDK